MMSGTKAPSTQPYIGGPVLVGNYNSPNGSIGNKNGALRNTVGLGGILLFVLGVYFLGWTM
jgi:hypothetical protein